MNTAQNMTEAQSHGGRNRSSLPNTANHRMPCRGSLRWIREAAAASEAKRVPGMARACPNALSALSPSPDAGANDAAAAAAGPASATPAAARGVAPDADEGEGSG